MIDLGKYATEVLSAYAVTFVLLGGLIWRSWSQYTRQKRALSVLDRTDG